MWRTWVREKSSKASPRKKERKKEKINKSFEPYLWRSYRSHVCKSHGQLILSSIANDGDVDDYLTSDVYVQIYF